MPWNGSGSTRSGLAELMSISLLNPSATSRNVRDPAGGTGARRRLERQRISSPGFAMTNIRRSREQRATSPSGYNGRSSSSRATPRRRAGSRRLSGSRPLRPEFAPRTLARRRSARKGTSSVDEPSVDRCSDTYLVPVDAHVRDDTHFVLAGRKRDVNRSRWSGDGRPGCRYRPFRSGARRVLDLQRRGSERQASLCAATLCSRSVIGPAGEHQQRRLTSTDSSINACSRA